MATPNTYTHTYTHTHTHIHTPMTLAVGDAFAAPVHVQLMERAKKVRTPSTNQSSLAKMQKTHTFTHIHMCTRVHSGAMAVQFSAIMQ